MKLKLDTLGISHLDCPIQVEEDDNSTRFTVRKVCPGEDNGVSGQSLADVTNGSTQASQQRRGTEVALHRKAL